MKLSEYVKKRNGVPIGHPNSLRNNLQRSLGANNFSTFWNFWNPIFGYYYRNKNIPTIKKNISNRTFFNIDIYFLWTNSRFSNDLNKRKNFAFFSLFGFY